MVYYCQSRVPSNALYRVGFVNLHSREVMPEVQAPLGDGFRRNTVVDSCTMYL